MYNFENANIRRWKSFFLAFVFLNLFIAPQCISAILPEKFQKLYMYLLLGGYILCSVYLIKSLFNKQTNKPLYLSISFIILGLINLVINTSTATFNLIGPTVAYLGYCFFLKEKINLKIFSYFLIAMYVFYYWEYYSILPDLFFRPEFDEDAEVFDMSSSNTIPISLNITLYAYIICDRFYENSSKNKILFFAIINFVLIVIQQSRAGLIISMILLAISMYHFSRKGLIIFSSFISTCIVYFLYAYKELIQTYFEVIGDLDVEALEEDIRGEAQSEFFRNMSIKEIVFGHSKKLYAGDAIKPITYTYNIFLDMWDKYGITILIIIAFIFLLRVIYFNKFEFPLYYFIPFLIYSLVESIFFPNFWDCIIYLLIFTPKFYYREHKIL